MDRKKLMLSDPEGLINRNVKKCIVCGLQDIGRSRDADEAVAEMKKYCCAVPARCQPKQKSWMNCLLLYEAAALFLIQLLIKLLQCWLLMLITDDAANVAVVAGLSPLLLLQKGKSPPKKRKDDDAEIEPLLMLLAALPSLEVVSMPLSCRCRLLLMLMKWLLIKKVAVDADEMVAV
ncbi:hypothetical protein J5N97_022651 [Dioscorea zingiberensis]|uniref:Uncharacterized protein n=1 Tax=Dioscorea zingiberensis TaxID=325984 RepID=A0A9D5CBB8_9LILI|nr:hypothetical protein J5N97_022651 [Dioscorea zingiberensis]